MKKVLISGFLKKTLEARREEEELLVFPAAAVVCALESQCGLCLHRSETKNLQSKV